MFRALISHLITMRKIGKLSQQTANANRNNFEVHLFRIQ